MLSDSGVSSQSSSSSSSSESSTSEVNEFGGGSSGSSSTISLGASNSSSSSSATSEGISTITDGHGSSSTGSGSVVTGIVTIGGDSHGSSTSTIAKQCFNSYTKCRNYDFCLLNNDRGQRYLCGNAYSQCSDDTLKRNLCLAGHLYDPNRDECITQLCPLVTSTVLTSEESGSGSSSSGSTSVVSSETTGSSSSSTSTSEETSTTTGDHGSTSTGSVSLGTGTSSAGSVDHGTSTPTTEQCFNSYSQCRTYDFCLLNNERGKRYLCANAYSQCSGNTSRRTLCVSGHLYDPNKNECITQLCPLVAITIITSESGVSGEGVSSSSTSGSSSSEESGNGSSSSSSTSVISSETSGSSSSSTSIIEETSITTGHHESSSSGTGSAGTGTGTGTGTVFVGSGSHNTSTTTTEQCFTSYSQCRDYDFCLLNNERGKRYLCVHAYSQCSGDTSRRNLCVSGHLYDPNKNECITQLCPLVTTPVLVSDSSASSVGVSSSTNESSTIITGTVSSGSSSQSSSSSTSEQCFTSYSHCRSYDFCLVNKKKGKRYLCANSYVQCPGETARRRLCVSGHLYDPNENKCITQLCPLVSIVVSGFDSAVSNEGVSSSSTSEDNSISDTSVIQPPVISQYCNILFSECKTYDVCLNTGVQFKQYLCVNATTECDGSNSRRLCNENQFYNPENQICVSSLCPINSSPSGEDEGNAAKPLDVPVTSTESAGLFVHSDSCYLSYSHCKVYDICFPNSVRDKKFLCKEAWSACTVTGKKRKLCLDQYLYEPNAKECVIDLCPFSSFSLSFITHGTSSSSETNSTSISQIMLPSSFNYTESVSCQTKYLYCKYFSDYGIYNSAQSDILCVCSDVCYFRGQEIRKSFICKAPLYDLRKGNCQFSAGSEQCLLGIIKPSKVDKGQSLRRFQDSIEDELDHFKKEGAVSELSKFYSSPAFRDASHYCSFHNERLRTYWIKYNMCSDIVLCQTGTLTKVWRVKTICSNYVQCVSQNGSWKLQISSCEEDEIFSYAQGKCIENKMDDKCTILKGTELELSLLRLVANGVSTKGKQFLNRRLSVYRN